MNVFNAPYLFYVFISDLRNLVKNIKILLKKINWFSEEITIIVWNKFKKKQRKIHFHL